MEFREKCVIVAKTQIAQSNVPYDSFMYQCKKKYNPLEHCLNVEASTVTALTLAWRKLFSQIR